MISFFWISFRTIPTGLRSVVLLFGKTLRSGATCPGEREVSAWKREQSRHPFGKDQTQEIPCYMITYIESVHNNFMIHLVKGATVKVRGSLIGFME